MSCLAATAQMGDLMSGAATAVETRPPASGRKAAGKSEGKCPAGEFGGAFFLGWVRAGGD